MLKNTNLVAFLTYQDFNIFKIKFFNTIYNYINTNIQHVTSFSSYKMHVT